MDAQAAAEELGATDAVGWKNEADEATARVPQEAARHTTCVINSRDRARRIDGTSGRARCARNVEGDHRTVPSPQKAVKRGLLVTVGPNDRARRIEAQEAKADDRACMV